MSGNKGLLDSNVIIDASKGIISTEALMNQYDYLYTSIISYVETLGYRFADEDEKDLVLQILSHRFLWNDKRGAKVSCGMTKNDRINASTFHK
ncbi:MAG: hypothetical protein RL329_3878 [Bacteroidota bacterium]|jgi:predicted nucleic acid-binding protein